MLAPFENFSEVQRRSIVTTYPHTTGKSTLENSIEYYRSEFRHVMLPSNATWKTHTLSKYPVVRNTGVLSFLTFQSWMISFGIPMEPQHNLIRLTSPVFGHSIRKLQSGGKQFALSVRRSIVCRHVNFSVPFEVLVPRFVVHHVRLIPRPDTGPNGSNLSRFVFESRKFHRRER